MAFRRAAVAWLVVCAATAQASDRTDGAGWKITASGPVSAGVRVLDGADGQTSAATRGSARCIANRSGADPPSNYLYFQVDSARSAGVRGPLYVAVDYFDSKLGGALVLEYDSNTGDSIGAKYRPAEDQAGGMASGSGKWKSAYFLLRRPQLAHRENLGADFRLTGMRLFVRAVRITHLRPANWNAANVVERIEVKPLVKIGAGGQLIVGGFDPARPEDGPRQARALAAALPALKSLGVTSHEVYVRWNLCEPSPGKYDWSVYDRYVQVYKASGLKWVPFLIVGSAYSLPDWYYKKSEFQGYVCLEHGQECDVQSLWNPALHRHLAAFIKAFCDHYRDTGVIESILLGITGNYGEAIYPATGNDWTADIHGPTHTHPGFWAGDKYAVESFRTWLARKYGGPGPFRDAWGERAGDLTKVRPLLRQDAPNERAWLDFCDWYIGSMTDYCRFWLREVRKSFPKGDVYICTGGHAPAEHGANFGDQCKVAAEFGAGVRITNEGSDYKGNYSLTRWVASAGRQYGSYFSFEPAGEVNANGVIVRIYNAAASGARGLHYYYPNLYGSDEASANFVEWGGNFRQRRPVVHVAVYYPETHIKLNTNDVLPYVQPLRDRFDFDYLSDEQIGDGGLGRVHALVMLTGNTSEARVWSKIVDWVRRGGLVIYPDGMGRLRTPEGDESWHDALFSPSAQLGKGRVAVFHGMGKSAEYRAFVAKTLAGAAEVDDATRAVIAADGEEDGVFATRLDTSEVLWLNTTGVNVVKGGTTIPAHGIGSTRIAR